jgi:hypothetical protein
MQAMRRFLLLLALLPFSCTPAADEPKPDGDADADADTDADTDADANTAPTAPVVAITPASPSDLSDLTVTLVTPSDDAEGDPVAYTYAWTVDGVARTDLTTATVGQDYTLDGETWSVAVTPSDGVASGEPGTSSVTIGNSPPTAAVIHIEPAEPVPGDGLVLTVDTAPSDPNGDPLTTTIQWYQNDSLVTSWDGLTSIEGKYTDGGDVFRVVYGATDGLSDPVLAEATVSIANTAPEIESVTLKPEDPVDADDLSVTCKAEDADGNDLAYSYTWWRDGVEATDVGDTTTVTADLTTVGEEWYATCEVSDGSAVVTLDSDPVSIVAFNGYKVKHTVSIKVTDTGVDATASGEWELDFESHGSSLGDNDCDVFWTIAAAEDESLCKNCTWAFETTFTYDLSSSVVSSGCTDLIADGSGTMKWTSRTDTIYADNEGPYYATSKYGYADSVTLSFAGSGSTYSYAGGRLRYLYYTATETEDTAGNTWLDLYRYQVYTY